MSVEQSGHRERLRKRFLADESSAFTEEALLELLLTYAIPQKDVAPLAHELVQHFGSLDALLDTEYTKLVEVNGLGTNSAVLIKLIDYLCQKYYSAEKVKPTKITQTETTLFDLPECKPPKSKPKGKIDLRPRPRSDLFGKSLLDQCIEFLPKLPDTESFDEIRIFLHESMHFNSEESRKRYTRYFLKRMFPLGFADKALRCYSQLYPNRQELRDVCYYRFCCAEPLMLRISEDLLIPEIGKGEIPRQYLADYLVHSFGTSNYIRDCIHAIFSTYKDSRILQVKTKTISLSYHEPLIPSFVFILHSEFPQPGIYDISLLENNIPIRSMLWHPDSLLSSLYELRNLDLISKVSMIDQIRQFSTRYTLEQVVEQLAKTGDVL